MNAKTTKTAISAILMISFAAAAGASVGASASKSPTAKPTSTAKAPAAAHSALDASAVAPWNRVTGVASTASA